MYDLMTSQAFGIMLTFAFYSRRCLAISKNEISVFFATVGCDCFIDGVCFGVSNRHGIVLD